MGIRIRLSRTPLSRNNPSYQIVVLPSSLRTTGRPLEILGAYNPIPVLAPPPSLSPNGQRRGAEWGPPQAKKVVSVQECGDKKVVWNMERVKYWLAQGAMPSKRVEKLLVTAGVLGEWQRVGWRRRRRRRCALLTPSFPLRLCRHERSPFPFNNCHLSATTDTRSGEGASRVARRR